MHSTNEVWPLNFKDFHCLKMQRSYQLWPEQNIWRIFSTNLQFGTFKVIYLEIWFQEKEKNLWFRFFYTSWNMDLSRPSKYPKNELLIQTLSVPKQS